MAKIQKLPCTQCGKLIAKGYSSWLSGIYLCEECMEASPRHQQRLSDTGRAQFGEHQEKKKEI
jgi:predicted  nucleic acid-binding Zn-ribbon protein